MARYVRFFVSYFPVIKKLSALFLACRIIKVSFRLSEKRQLWEYNIRAVLKISAQWSASRVQRPESSVQRPGSNVQIPESSIQSPASRVQRPGSSVQSPVSRVQRPTLASRVQEFRYAFLECLVFYENFFNKCIWDRLLFIRSGFGHAALIGCLAAYLTQPVKKDPWLGIGLCIFPILYFIIVFVNICPFFLLA